MSLKLNGVCSDWFEVVTDEKIRSSSPYVPEETVGDYMEGQGQKRRHQQENWFKETRR